MEVRQHVVMPTTAPGTRNFPIQIILLGFALLLELVGYVTPGWAVLEFNLDDWSVHAGLWYRIVCPGKDKPCETHSMFDREKVTVEAAQELQGEQIETSFAVLCAVVTVVIVIMGHRMGENQPSRTLLRTITPFFAIISGVLALVSSGGTADEHVKSAQRLKDEGYDDIIKFPYSLFLFGVGGIIMCCMGIYFFVKLLSQCAKQQRQMNNTPNTQNGVINAQWQNMAYTSPTVVGASNTTGYAMAVSQPPFVQNMDSNSQAGPYVAPEKTKQISGPYVGHGVANAGYVGSTGHVGTTGFTTQTQPTGNIQYHNSGPVSTIQYQNSKPVSTQATKHVGHTTKHFMAL